VGKNVNYPTNAQSRSAPQCETSIGPSI